MSIRVALLLVHVLAAIAWIGGMLFLVLVVGPFARAQKPPERVRLFRELGRRFRPVAWVALGLLYLTGIGNVWAMGVSVAALLDWSFYQTPFGQRLGAKLGFVVVATLVSAYHDFVLGPRASELGARGDSAAYRRLRRLAGVLGRIVFVLAVVIVWLALRLSRG